MAPPSPAPPATPEAGPAAQHAARVTAWFDRAAATRDAWLRKSAYYHRDLAAFLRFLVPAGRRVLEIGSGTGDLLAALRPSEGLGVDISPVMVARAAERHPGLRFVHADAERLAPEGTWDYIVMANVIGLLYDVQSAFAQLRPLCRPETRVVITHYNRLWQPLLNLSERIGLKMPQPSQNWLAPEDVENLLRLNRFEVVRRGMRLMCPVFVPGLSWILNRVLAHLPGFRHLCLTSYVVARPLPDAPSRPTVTVIIPTRNEAGNVAEAVRRTPQLGPHTEILFVEGHSEDGTRDRIREVQAAHPQRDIKLLVQSGRGKANAVFEAMEQATGDLFVILDGDLTMPPEELPKFYDAYANGHGEFINGCRLVYPMENEAMRFLNMVANHTFALLFTWVLGVRLKDTLCGTKMISRRHYRDLRDGMAYFGAFDPFGDFQLIFGAVKLSLKVIDMPVHYKARTYGTTQIRRFHDGLLLLRMVMVAMRKLKFV